MELPFREKHMHGMYIYDSYLRNTTSGKKFVWRIIENIGKGKPLVYIFFSSGVVCSNRGRPLTCYALEYTCRVLGELLEETSEGMQSKYILIHFLMSISFLP